jgi:hypothetical protein
LSDTTDEQKMTTLWPDTHSSAEQVQMDLMRRMPAWRKLELMAEMGETLHALALAGLRQRYPNDSPAHRKRRLAELMLGPELAVQVCGPFQIEEK